MFQYSPILERSSIEDLKYTFSNFSYTVTYKIEFGSAENLRLIIHCIIMVQNSHKKLNMVLSGKRKQTLKNNDGCTVEKVYHEVLSVCFSISPYIEVHCAVHTSMLVKY